MEMRIRLSGGKKVTAEFGAFKIVTDQPVDGGGEGSAPAPFDLFLASVGTCAGFFVQSFCQARGIPTQNLGIVLRSDWDEVRHLTSKIRIEIELPKEFPEKYRQSLVSAVNQCTVKKHLQQPPSIEVETHLSVDAIAG